VPRNGVGGSDGGGKKGKNMEIKTFEYLNKFSCCEHLQEEKESVNLHKSTNL